VPDANCDFLGAADRIGAALCRDALWSGKRCNWLGASMESLNGAWTTVHRAFGPELYSGTSGVALFLARLFSLTGAKPYLTAARGAVAQALTRLDDISLDAHIGFYSGLTGIAYALHEVAEALDRPGYATEALRILQSQSAEHPGGQGLDVISGSAGAIPVLLRFYRQSRQDFLLYLAIGHAEHLLSAAERSDHGWSWNTLHTPVQANLTGFSHGAAGIGWALVEIFAETHEERFREAAQQAFRYERHCFSAEHDNWPDFRSFNQSRADANGTGFMMAWCHGAPGIGLSRLRAYRILGDPLLLEEAETALRSTAKSLNNPSAGGSYSLCHGHSGNAELAIYAAQVLGTPEHGSLAAQVGRQGIEHYRTNRIPWPCGVLQGGETPGLMLGLAGIGYFYLRLHDPARVPSVLIVGP